MQDTISTELMTDVRRIEYDCKTATGRVFMARDCCVDMTSTILLFERLAQDVCVIETFAGDRRVTSYHRTSPEQWRAVSPDGRSWPPARCHDLVPPPDSLHRGYLLRHPDSGGCLSRDQVCRQHPVIPFC
jgi:hypothetical protein